MLSRSILWIVLLTVGSVPVAGCRMAHPRGASAQLSAGQVGSQGSPASTDPASEPDRIEAHAHYSAAVIHEANGEPALALQEYYQAARKDPADEALVLEVSRRFLQADRPKEAMELLVRASARPDASGALFARLGQVYLRLGKIDLAAKADRTAIKRQPQLLAGYRNLSLVYLQNQKVNAAGNVLDEAAGVSGTDAEFLIGLAELFANFGLKEPAKKPAAYARALELLLRAEKLGPSDAESRLRLADGYNLLGKDEEAAGIYMDLLQQLPDLPLVHENIRAKLMDLSLRSRDPKLAARQLEAVIRDNPIEVRAYYLLGSVAYDEKRYAAAADYFNKALLLDPAYEPAYYDLASAQISAEKAALSVETLDKARRKFQSNFVLEYLSGIAYSRLKDYTNSVRRFRAAEVFAPAGDTNRLTEFYFQFGAACERQGDAAQAGKYFEKCLQLSPDFPEALNYLGFMLADRGEKLDQARALIERAVKVEPKNASYLDSMGWVLFKLQRPKEALGWILKAIQFSAEEDPVIYDHLGDIYGALGQPEKARSAWGKSLALEPDDRVRKKLEGAAAK